MTDLKNRTVFCFAGILQKKSFASNILVAGVARFQTIALDRKVIFRSSCRQVAAKNAEYVLRVSLVSTLIACIIYRWCHNS